MPLNEQQRQQLDGIVERMQQEGESDTNIQLVVNDFKSKYEGPQPPSGAASAAGYATGGAAALIPGVVSLANRAATVAPTVAAGVRTGGRAMTAGAAAGEALRGNYKNAAGIAAGGAALEAVPAVARRVAAATAPATEVASTLVGPTGAPLTRTVAPGALARTAAAVGRFGNVAGLVAGMAGEAGDGRSTPDETAARQRSFAHQFKEQVNREAGREVITGNTVAEIIESIAKYRGSK